ncbi:MAG: hydroxymethylbilane synthase [Myxococcota bacterium]|nr:hydroxymethylbilane synthase [Myxococcota bacterium]
MKVRIGTRGSALARWQADAVFQMLRSRHPGLELEIIVVKTTGDVVQDKALSELPGKAFFTKEIEDALLASRIDLAVHSGKDVPTELPHGLALAGFLKRHSPLDVLVTPSGSNMDKSLIKSLFELDPGARIGTSSVRRRAFIANLRPDLRILDLRGNVDTRLKKLDQGLYDGIVLAEAGLERLGLGDRIAHRLDRKIFLPAVSQGAMALETRSDDSTLMHLLAPLMDGDTTTAVTAERALLRTLEGGCQVPLGALAEVAGEALTLTAAIVAPDGTARVDGAIQAHVRDANKAGIQLAGELVENGGGEILKKMGRR